MAGYKTFVAGEEALAADINSYLMGQTVARFANASARTAALTAPATNQLSMLDNRPGVVQYWTGSAWADTAPFIQSGFAGPTADASGNATVAYPVAFAGAPVVSLTSLVSGVNAPFTLSVVAETSNATQLGVRAARGATIITGLIQFYWVAIGLRTAPS